MAGTSAIRQPRHSSWVTDKLQKQLLRARTRQGIVPAVADDVKAHLAAGGFGLEIGFALGELLGQFHRPLPKSPVAVL